MRIQTLSLYIQISRLLKYNMKINSKEKGFVSMIAILIIVSLTILYMVNILDGQYNSSKKSSLESELETPNISNAIEKTKNLKESIESTNSVTHY